MAGKVSLFIEVIELTTTYYGLYLSVYCHFVLCGHVNKHDIYECCIYNGHSCYKSSSSNIKRIRDIVFAQGQENLTSSSSLTPEQQAAICSSVGSHVNTTESKICGIPTTPSSNATSSENATTGAEVPTADARE